MKLEKKADQTWRNTCDAMSDLVSVHDKDFRIVKANKALADFLGVKPEALIGKRCYEVIHCTKEPWPNCPVAKTYQSKKPVIEEVNDPNIGAPLLVTASPIFDDKGELWGSVHIVKNISELKRAEERIKRLNKTFLGLGTNFDSNIDLLTHACGEILKADCALYNRLEGGLLCSIGKWQTPAGYNPRDKPEGHICYDVIKRYGEGGIYEVRNLHETSYYKTDPNVARYGLKTYVGHPVTCDGKTVGSICVVYQHDVEFDENDRKVLEIIAKAIGIEEERKKAEEAVKRSEEKYRRLVESVEKRHFLYSHGTDGVFTYLSPSIEAILGYTPKEFMTHYTTYLTPSPVNKEVERHTELSIKGIQQPPYEVEIYHKNGSIRWLGVNEVPVFDDKGDVIAGFGTKLIQVSPLL